MGSEVVDPTLTVPRPERRRYQRHALPCECWLENDALTIWRNLSGDSLHKRGYRPVQVKSPLNEATAAGLLRLSGWDRASPLVDPMCGSGTFLLEAALMAHDIAPGLARKFGFFRLDNFDAALWQKLLTEAEARKQPFVAQPIFGSDISQDQVERARQNLAAAGMHECVRLECADLLQRSPPAADGVLVANPPYGIRLEEQEWLAAFYPKLGDALKQRFAGWRCYFISADPQLPKLIGLKASRRTPLFNGALECRLLEYRIISGPMRRKSAESG